MLWQNCSGFSIIENSTHMEIATYQATPEYYNRKRRVHRGLFVSNQGVKINADVNATYQIITKEITNAFADGIEGVGLHPLIVKLAS